MALGAPTLFAVPPDGVNDAQITRAYLSDVIRARFGTEKRASLRSSGVRTLRYSALFMNQAEAADFRNAWLAATERLRYLVPLWPEYTTATSFPTTSTIAGDFTNRDFVQGGQVLVWQGRGLFEVALVDALADSLLTLDAPLANTYVPLAAQVIPLMPAWLEVPSMGMLTTTAEAVPVVFEEELAGIAGVAEGAGDSSNPACASLTAESIYTAQNFSGGQLFYGWIMHAYDAMGFEIPNPTITWTITPTGDVSIPPAIFDVTGDGRMAALQFVGGAASSFTVTATCGTVTITVPVPLP